MAQENENDRVSREAHERIVAERDQYKTLADEAKVALADMRAREQARSWFKENGAADPDMGAEAAFPHLRGVEPEQFGEILGREIFKPYLNAAAAAAREAEAPVVEPASSFSGPSPGSAGQPIVGATATISQLKAKGFSREQIVAEMEAGRAVPDDATLMALKSQAAYRQRGR